MSNQQEALGEIAKQNFTTWEQSLHTGQPEQVAKLYSNDATFLPTVSPEFKRGTTEALGYFEHFLQKAPCGKIVKDAVQSLGSDTYLHSGLYNFELGPENSRTTVEARFSYVWKKENGEWKIIHHHSSVKPQG